MSVFERHLEVGDKSIGLRFTNSSVAELEVKFDLTYTHIVNRISEIYTSEGKERRNALEAIGMRQTLGLFWAALEGYRRKHKTRVEAYTIEEASELMDEAGGAGKVSPHVGTVFGAYMMAVNGADKASIEKALGPKEEEEEKEKESKNAPKGGSSSGKGSSSKRSKSG